MVSVETKKMSILFQIWKQIRKETNFCIPLASKIKMAWSSPDPFIMTRKMEGPFNLSTKTILRGEK